MTVQLSGQNSVLSVGFVLFYSVDLVVLFKVVPLYLYIPPFHFSYLSSTLAKIECSSYSPFSHEGSVGKRLLVYEPLSLGL